MLALGGVCIKFKHHQISSITFLFEVFFFFFEGQKHLTTYNKVKRKLCFWLAAFSRSSTWI